jgi:hypothetical protein
MINDPDLLLKSTDYNLIYNLLHNVYIYKSEECLGKALEICETNFKDADYKSLLNTILINDLDNGLKVMDKNKINYDRRLMLSYAKAFSATKCQKYLEKKLD